MKFREAIMSDKYQLLALEQKVVDAERPFNTDIKEGKPIYYEMEDLIIGENSHLIVAEENGEIVGTGYSQIQKSKASLQHEYHAYLGFMFVSPKCRGKGLNQQIIKKLISWSKNKGVNDHYLDVYSDNASAIRAYEKIGFKACMIEMKLNSK